MEKATRVNSIVNFGDFLRKFPLEPGSKNRRFPIQEAEIPKTENNKFERPVEDTLAIFMVCVSTRKSIDVATQPLTA